MSTKQKNTLSALRPGLEAYAEPFADDLRDSINAGDYAKRIRSAERKRGVSSTRKAVVGTAAGLAGLAAVVAVGPHVAEFVGQPVGIETEVAAIREALDSKHEARDNAVVIAEGAAVRKTPVGESGANNLAFRIDADKALLIEGGIRYNGWVGFQERDADGKLPDLGENPSVDAIADTMLWVNVSGLNKDAKESGEPSRVTSFDRAGATIESSTMHVETHNDGHFYSYETHVPLAIGQQIEADQIPQVVQSAGYEFSTAA